jgi:hypothetical protein
MSSASALAVILAAASLANPINLKRVPRGEVVILQADFLLEMADGLRKKLDGVAATRTYHVVMAAPVVLMLVAGDAVVKGNLARQAAFGQQFQRAIDRRIANAGVFFLHQSMEFIGRKMVASLQKRAQNRIPLRGLLKADLFQMPVQNFLGFARHLARNGRLVIDAILQHDMR